MNVGIELDSTGPTNNNIEEEESKENISSFNNSFISMDDQQVLKKPENNIWSNTAIFWRSESNFWIDSTHNEEKRLKSWIIFTLTASPIAS